MHPPHLQLILRSLPGVMGNDVTWSRRPTDCTGGRARRSQNYLILNPARQSDLQSGMNPAGDYLQAFNPSTIDPARLFFFSVVWFGPASCTRGQLTAAVIR